MITKLNEEKLKVLTGFKLGDDILISDSDHMYNFDEETGERKEVEKVRVIIEPSLLKFWIEECGLLEELGINGTIW